MRRVHTGGSKSGEEAKSPSMIPRARLEKYMVYASPHKITNPTVPITTDNAKNIHIPTLSAALFNVPSVALIIAPPFTKTRFDNMDARGRCLDSKLQSFSRILSGEKASDQLLAHF
jgi:hypothetical protein